MNTAFIDGFNRGRKTKSYLSRNQVSRIFPRYTDEQVSLFLNGLDDGVVGDFTRVAPMRLSTLPKIIK